jgi:hypothetical protein
MISPLRFGDLAGQLGAARGVGVAFRAGDVPKDGYPGAEVTQDPAGSGQDPQGSVGAGHDGDGGVIAARAGREVGLAVHREPLRGSLEAPGELGHPVGGEGALGLAAVVALDDQRGGVERLQGDCLGGLGNGGGHGLLLAGWGSGHRVLVALAFAVRRAAGLPAAVRAPSHAAGGSLSRGTEGHLLRSKKTRSALDGE